MQQQTVVPNKRREKWKYVQRNKESNKWKM